MRLPFFRKKQPELPASRQGGPLGNSQRRIGRQPKTPPKPWGKKERFLIIGILVGTVLIALSSWMSSLGYRPTLEPPKIAVPSQTFTFEKETPMPTTNSQHIAKVIDGDTVVLSSRETVRYIGIDSPERGDCFFEEAKAANERLVLGKIVELEKDVSEVDKYRRLLRYVWVIGDVRVMVNEQLVREGFATVSTYPPDVAYQERFLSAQKDAREEKLGIWADRVCPNESNLTNETNVLSAREEEKPLSKSEDKDCSDFKTHQEAQDFFISQGGPSADPHKLDRDGDGVACESLP